MAGATHHEQTQRKRGDVETCYHDGYQAVTDRKAEEYKTRALSDPALMAKYSKLAQENNAAAMKGDSAATNRLLRGMYEEILPSKEDSARVRNECGPLPPKSAAEQQMEAFDKQITAVHDSIAVIDDRVAKAQAKQGGLDQQQWGMALERLQMYSGLKNRKNPSKGEKSAVCGYTRTEVEAIEANLAQINATLGH